MSEVRIVAPLLAGGWRGLEDSRGAANVLVLCLATAYVAVDTLNLH